MTLKIIVFILFVYFFNGSDAYPRHQRLPRIVTVNPKRLFDPLPLGYSHIRVDIGTGLAFIAGQVAIDVNGTIIGKNDLEKQLQVTVNNIKIALSAIGASIDDIISINGFIKNFDPAKDLATFRPFGVALGSPVSTVVSTPSLALEDLLVEIEVRAIASPRFLRRQYKMYRKAKKW